jgi:hypothetical protein
MGEAFDAPDAIAKAALSAFTTSQAAHSRRTIAPLSGPSRRAPPFA